MYMLYRTCLVRLRRAALPAAALLLASAPPALAAATAAGLPTAPPLLVALLAGLLPWTLLLAALLWAALAVVSRLGRPTPAPLLRGTLLGQLVLAPLAALAAAAALGLPRGLGWGPLLALLSGMAGALSLGLWLLAAAGLLAAYGAPRAPWLQPALAAGALALSAWLLLLPPPAAPPAPLILADNAGDVLVQLAYTPGRFRLDLSDARLRPVTGATVNLHLVPLAGQDGERRLTAAPGLQGITYGPRLKTAAYTAAATLAPAGRWRVEVSVARPDTAAVSTAFQFESDGGTPALPVLQAADAALNRLRSLRQREWLGYGEQALVTDFAYAAPDRLYFKTNKGYERLAIGAVMYEREAGEDWSKGTWPGLKPFAWPDFNYAGEAVDVRLVDQESVAGRPCLVVAFLHGPSGARFRWWVDAESHLLHRAVMMAPGHFMHDEYTDFDQPVSIEAPLP